MTQTEMQRCAGLGNLMALHLILRDHRRGATLPSSSREALQPFVLPQTQVSFRSEGVVKSDRAVGTRWYQEAGDEKPRVFYLQHHLEVWRAILTGVGWRWELPPTQGRG